MAYYPDLSPYSYDALDEQPEGEDVSALRGALNVGWLQAGIRYPRGAVPANFVTGLFRLCSQARWGHRGIHACNLGWCPVIQIGHYKVHRRGGCVVRLGSRVVIVRGPHHTYAAPDLVYHYVVRHKYRPPAEFIEAVLRSDG